jgi:hypothetical protein
LEEMKVATSGLSPEELVSVLHEKITKMVEQFNDNNPDLGLLCTIHTASLDSSMHTFDLDRSEEDFEHYLMFQGAIVEQTGIRIRDAIRGGPDPSAETPDPV